MTAPVPARVESAKIRFETYLAALSPLGGRIHAGYATSGGELTSAAPLGGSVTYVNRSGVGLGVFGEYSPQALTIVTLCDMPGDCGGAYTRAGVSLGYERTFQAVTPWTEVSGAYVRTDRYSNPYGIKRSYMREGFGVGASAGIRFSPKRFSVGPFLGAHYDRDIAARVTHLGETHWVEHVSTDALLLTAGIKVGYTLPLYQPAPSATQAAERAADAATAPAEATPPRGARFALRGGYALWDAREAQIGASLPVSGPIDVAVGASWLRDTWLCHVKGTEPGDCTGQRWQGIAGVHYWFSPRIRFGGHIGAFHRWSRDREAHPLLRNSTLVVRREQTGALVGGSCAVFIQRLRHFDYGLEASVASLTSVEEFWPDDYIEEDPVFVVEPKLLVTFEVKP